MTSLQGHKSQLIITKTTRTICHVRAGLRAWRYYSLGPRCDMEHSTVHLLMDRQHDSAGQTPRSGIVVRNCCACGGWSDIIASLKLYTNDRKSPEVCTCSPGTSKWLQLHQACEGSLSKWAAWWHLLGCHLVVLLAYFKSHTWWTLGRRQWGSFQIGWRFHDVDRGVKVSHFTLHHWDNH